MKKLSRIVFVWNADFSLASGIRALKEVVEGHHSCTLCEIAYHRISQTKEWQAYKKELAGNYKTKIRQPCRNQLKAAEIAAVADDFPAVLVHTEVGVVKLLGSQEIDNCEGQFALFRAKLDEAIRRFCNE